jgi:two-component system chemotaxis response regulator CheB
MKKRDIITIGASAGGFEALRQLIGDLPDDLDASIFIVWHISADVKGILPRVLSKETGLAVSHAVDREPIERGHVYVAPPDHHLVLERGLVRVTRGPKENRFRPAIDPLFRSAALAYGPQVIGVVLTGALDDGAAGLWTIKQYGGLAIVQDPLDAEVPSMPQHAINAVETDYIVPGSDIGGLLARLVSEPIPDTEKTVLENDGRTETEVLIAMEDSGLTYRLFQHGEPTAYTCPECHGVLAALVEGNRVRFRCHTGHAFSADSLLAAITENIESSLWSAVRNIRESVILLNHMGDHLAEINQPKLAALYFKKAKEAEERALIVRKTTLNHEQLSTEEIRQEARHGGDQ